MEQFGLKTQEKKERTPPFHTPFGETTLLEFTKKFPEKRESMEVILNEIDLQEIENFNVFQSETMPGVSFSFTKLSITPELIHKLSKFKPTENQVINDEQQEEGSVEIEQGSEEKTEAKKQDYFLFTAFGVPPDGNAFNAGDIAIDRFIRLLPRVSGAIERGEKIPEINLYLLGAPTGFGGSVTQKWKDGVEKNGLDEHGKLYAEFIKQHEPINKDNVHIVLQGVSKGAVVAEKTSRYLPEELQNVTQRLLDNPAGDHMRGKISTWIKGAQVVAGMGLETISRMLFDDTMKRLMKTGPKFLDNLSKKTGIKEDTKEQRKLKFDAAIAEAMALLKGSPRDEGVRSFIRRGIHDPLTFSPKRLLEIWQKQKNEDTPIPMFQKGKSLEVPFKGYHFFLYNRYQKWVKVLNSIEKTEK